MRALVAGSTGQLASALRDLAQSRQALEIVTMGRPELDLELAGSAERAVASVHPDVVINCAAYTGVDAAEGERDRAFRINADAAGELARAARTIGAPMIQLSTDYVFDGIAGAPYSEDAPARPLNIYGASKLDGEEQVRLANPDHLVIRTAWLFSHFGSNFVTRMLSLARSQDEIAVVTDQRGSPSFAPDVAQGLLIVLERWRAGDRTGMSEVFNLAGPTEASWFDLARDVFDEAARVGLPAAHVKPIRSGERRAKAARPPDSRLYSAKFASAFGFRVRRWQSAVPIAVRATRVAEPGP